MKLMHRIYRRCVYPRAEVEIHVDLVSMRSGKVVLEASATI